MEEISVTTPKKGEPKPASLPEVTPIDLHLDQETIEILLEDRIATGG